MKWIKATALVVAITVHSAIAQLPSAPTWSKEIYADQNGQELRQVRHQVDTVARRASTTAQSRFAQIYDALVEAEQALAEFKTAGDQEIPRRRAVFEGAKTKVVRLWRDFRLNPR